MDLVLLLDSFISSVQTPEFVSVILFSARTGASTLRGFNSGCNAGGKRSITLFCEVRGHLFKRGGQGEWQKKPD